jgi:hypothetical protein
MTLRRALKRLRLREGDVLIVRDPDLFLRLGETGIPGFKLNIPIIYAEGKHDLEVKHG